MSSVRRYRFHKIDDNTLVNFILEVKDVFEGVNLSSHVSLMDGLSLSLGEVVERDNLVGQFAFQNASIAFSLEFIKKFSASIL